MTYLHVDIDPRAGEDFEEERVRALAKLRAYPIKPTFIVDSGGGFQGFWRLKDPYIINGDVEKYEDAKRYNLQLEMDLDGDNCHNVDRIMRLPGTINIPDARKEKKGRKRAVARLVEHNKDADYTLSTFRQAPLVQVQSPDLHSSSIPKVNIPGNVRRLGSVDELGDNLSPNVRELIVQGKILDDPGKYPSRSEALWFVVCSLIRAGISDELRHHGPGLPHFGKRAGTAVPGPVRAQTNRGCTRGSNFPCASRNERAPRGHR
jgi:hypothetical protein